MCSLEQRSRHPFPRLGWMALFSRLAVGSAPASRGRTGLPTVTSRLWYRAVLCDALIGAHQVPMIREHVADALGAAGWPEGACVFLSRRQPAGTRLGKGDSAVPEAIFFSPAAITAVPHLIVVCGAEPSAPPERACTTLLVGRQSDWDLLPRALH